MRRIDQWFSFFGVVIVVSAAVVPRAACAQCEILAMEPPDPANKGLFGGNVAIDGDLLAVADPWFNEFRGAVYVYQRVASEWALLHAIDDEALSPDAAFGQALAIDGVHLVVGAPRNENERAPDGTVFIYRIEPTQVVREATLTGFHAAKGDPPNGVRFGESVAIDGDRVAVGWPGFAFGGGRIEIYERAADRTWQSRRVAAEGAAFTGLELGHRVAFDGDVLLAGVPSEDSVFAYRLNSDNWILDTVFAPGSGIGSAIDIQENVAVMGAHQGNGNRAFVSRYRDGAWSALQVVTTEHSTGPDPDFGWAVALNENATVLVIGARTDHVDGFHSGAAHVFHAHDETWVEHVKLSPTDGVAGNEFSFNLAISGETAAFSSNVTAYLFDGLAGTDCDGNGVADGCDIATGAQPDRNDNGIPDICELPADLNGDGSVDLTDLIQLLAAWGDCAGPCVADLDGDGSVGFNDVLLLLAVWSR